MESEEVVSKELDVATLIQIKNMIETLGRDFVKSMVMGSAYHIFYKNTTCSGGLQERAIIACLIRYGLKEILSKIDEVNDMED